MAPEPLTGKLILVTRAAHQAGKLSDALRELGATPVEVPLLQIQPPDDLAPLDKAIRRLDTYDWLILTSANTVRAVVERSAILGLALEQPPQPQIAAIGVSTAAAARDAGFSIALVPEAYVAESLVESVLGRQEVSGHGFSRADQPQKKTGASDPEESFTGKRILLARAAVARDVIPDALRAAGAIVDVVDAYRNVMPAAAPELLRKAIEHGIAAATFTSSSSVTHLAEAAKAAGLAFPFAAVAAISIGPITSQTLREHGWEPAAEANPSDIPGLVAAVRSIF
jgi:uroporphyrinogen-III synthase/uroporphyrinogen III methyltransferase/synthase